MEPPQSNRDALLDGAAAYFISSLAQHGIEATPIILRSKSLRINAERKTKNNTSPYTPN